LIDFDVERERDIVTNQLKPMVIEQMIDVAPRAGEEVIDAYDDSAIRQQPLAEVRTEEASPPGNHYPCFKMHVLAIPLNCAITVDLGGPSLRYVP
jgi:hypothetical protein